MENLAGLKKEMQEELSKLLIKLTNLPNMPDDIYKQVDGCRLWDIDTEEYRLKDGIEELRYLNALKDKLTNLTEEYNVLRSEYYDSGC